MKNAFVVFDKVWGVNVQSLTNHNFGFKWALVLSNAQIGR